VRVLGTRRVALGCSLSEDGIAALRDGVKGRVLTSEPLGGGVKEGEAGDPLSRWLRRGRRVMCRGGEGSESEAIVFSVCANPEPGDDFAFTNAEGAMVIADSDDTDAISSFLEFQRRMKAGRVARVSISRARVFEQWRAGRRSASRIGRAFGRSREVLKTTCANVRSNFFGDRTKASAVGEVAIDLAIPGGVVALPDEGGELCQFIGGERLYGSLYFGETHSWSVSRPWHERNPSA